MAHTGAESQRDAEKAGSLKILICKVFGIGNSVLAIPMIKAIRQANPDAQIDVLVGSGPDDVGAWEVLSSPGIGIDSVFRGGLAVPYSKYDFAVLSIPYDGRWKNGRDFFADAVIDGRTRPDPSTTGFISWKKHEIEYQMENAYALGFSGAIPRASFLSTNRKKNTVCVGVGYKKDAAGFWGRKHWGNLNFSRLIKMMLEEDKYVVLQMFGDAQDLVASMAPISRIVRDPRLIVSMKNLRETMDEVASCSAYVGNDTGLMHVAAVHDVPVVCHFALEGSLDKVRPWTEKHVAFESHLNIPSPEKMFDAYKRLRVSACE